MCETHRFVPAAVTKRIPTGAVLGSGRQQPAVAAKPAQQSIDTRQAPKFIQAPAPISARRALDIIDQNADQSSATVIAAPEKTQVNPTVVRRTPEGATGEVRRDLGKVLRPSEAPRQQATLESRFAEFCATANGLPAGGEHRDVRREQHQRLFTQMCRALDITVIPGDKHRAAGLVRKYLSQKVPSGTDVNSLLPQFIKDWELSK